MKPLLFVFHLLVIAPAILGQPLGLAFPDLATAAGGETQLLGYIILFGTIGLAVALVGYKLFELGIVGDLQRAPDRDEQGPGEDSAG